jgi:pantoate--beta-alanine ligase
VRHHRRSVFVNPAQFGPQEDLSNYPRDLERDLAMLERYKVDYVFFPTSEMMYPAGYLSWITVEGISGVLCGASRPGHFKGVATIVAKLVNLVNPGLYVYGGEGLPADSGAGNHAPRPEYAHPDCPLSHREGKDGLALSSRNKYLDKNERKKALCLVQIPEIGKRPLQQRRDRPQSAHHCHDNRHPQSGGKIDYIAFADPNTLQPVPKADDRTRVLLAVEVS